MESIRIEAHVSTEQLLHAVEQLPPQEFAPFLARLLSLRAQRRQSDLGRPAAVIDHETLAQLAEQVQASWQRVLGLNKGALITGEDFDEPLPDNFWLGVE